jgi:pimeloyl-ACP methyl ester carboxylesterase
MSVNDAGQQLRPSRTPTPWGEIHALVGGVPERGDMVVVPGLAVSAYLRPSVACAASAGYRAWLPDPPGFGHSGDPPRRLAVQDAAEAISQWMRSRELRAITLVGHSSGTQVAAHIAARVPDLVDRLVLGSPTVDPRYRSWLKAVSQWRRDGRLEPPSLVRTQRPEWRRAGPARLLRMIRSMLRDDLETTLTRVRCSRLIIRGEQDPLCTREWAGRLAKGHVLVEIPQLPHAFPYQAPTVWIDALGGETP